MSQPSPAVDDLINDLRSANKRTRAKAAKALGESRDPRAVQPLIEALSDHSDVVRHRAVFALGLLRDPRAVEPLVASMGDPEPRVRSCAASAVKKFGHRAYQPLVSAYRGGGPNLRFGVLGALTRFKDAAVSELLIAALDDPEMNVRAEAARVLGVRKDPRGVEHLIAKLAEGGAARWLYVRALAQIGDRRAFEPLTQLLADTSLNPMEQREVVNALRAIDNPAAVDHFYDRLEQPNDAAGLPFSHTLAGVDLMNATESLTRKGAASPFALLQALLATGSALRTHVDSLREDEAATTREDVHAKSVERLRGLESVLRALGRKPR